MKDYAHIDTSEKECIGKKIFEGACFVLFFVVAPVVSYAVYLDW